MEMAANESLAPEDIEVTPVPRTTPDSLIFDGDDAGPFFADGVAIIGDRII
jgi:hypothetical protein